MRKYTHRLNARDFKAPDVVSVDTWMATAFCAALVSLCTMPLRGAPVGPMTPLAGLLRR